ncbi:hypothetical protein Mapa_003062 [Marchantia paleacea]|nr:hypothetical protein Mapa_003062 [Marchantia paleacea]
MNRPSRCRPDSGETLDKCKRFLRMQRPHGATSRTAGQCLPALKWDPPQLTMWFPSCYRGRTARTRWQHPPPQLSAELQARECSPWTNLLVEFGGWNQHLQFEQPSQRRCGLAPRHRLRAYRALGTRKLLWPRAHQPIAF